VGRHAAARRGSRARTAALLSCLPLVLLATALDGAPADATPASAPLVTPAADGSVPDVAAPDGYYPGP
jgi:hypothetical protein